MTIEDDSGLLPPDLARRATDQALAEAYPDQPTPFRWAPSQPGNEVCALESVSVWRASQPTAHWHYVTAGLSERFGMELTFRLADQAALDAEAVIPDWPIGLLNNLARYISRTQNPLFPGQHMNTRGPIKLGAETLLAALALCADPLLGTINMKEGELRFVQAVGITVAEEQAGSNWDMRDFLELFEAHYPWAVTVLERSDLMTDPAFAATVAQGTTKDGSSTGLIQVKHLLHFREDEVTVVELGASAVEQVTSLAPLRIRFDDSLLLCSADAAVTLRPGAPQAKLLPDGSLAIYLDAEAADALAATLLPQRGDYLVPGLDDVRWRVLASEITDQQGNVIEVLG